MRRRDFLFGLASFVHVACGSGAGGGTTPAADGGPPPPAPLVDAGRPLTPTSSAEASDRVFPQGVVSGDPRPDRVILWTRVEPAQVGRGEGDDVEIEYLIARDEALADVAARGSVKAEAAADHTVRLVPTGLESGRHYYYRFEVSGTTTQVGRTKTAPDPAADVAVKFAFCSCQDFIGRYYHSWRALLEEKADLDFILYLGDYIYESVNDPRFQTTAPDREIKLPDGIDTSAAQDKSRIAAGTLADYRTLYKTYRKDPLLKEVHRLYPFIVCWDDHEFADDCWQDHSTSFNELDPITKGFTDEKNTPRRMAANRAFFEYQPADVVTKPLPFPFDIQIYRTLRWGRHVEIVVTDQRSYRADHLIPEGPTDLSVGKVTENTLVGSRYFVRKAAFDAKEETARPSLLGEPQKKWLLDVLKKSTATWKLWANEVQMYEMALDVGLLPGVPDLIKYVCYLNVDQWDGFRSERKEILNELSLAGVDNLFVVTGDIHSFWAAELHVDFAAPTAKPAGVEYVTAGISSASLKQLVGKLIPPTSGLRPIADAWADAADDVLKTTNPHVKYADSDAYGFSLVTIDGGKAEVTFVQLGNPSEATYKGVVARQRFVTMRGTNKITVV